VASGESFPAYRRRILGYLGTRDPIRVQKTTAARLARLIEEIPPRVMRRRPAPGSWSILEVLVHMVDAELAYGWRLRNMLATPGVALPWWDQDEWARRLAYPRRRPVQAVDWFRALRESNLALLAAVPRRRWSTCFGIHEVRGRISVLELVRQEAGHDLAHLLQIRRLLVPLRVRARASRRPRARV